MNKETEGLMENMEACVRGAIPTSALESVDKDILYAHIKAATDNLLQVCKDAGLKFVPDTLNLEYMKLIMGEGERIVWDKTKKLIEDGINEQIREIE